MKKFRLYYDKDAEQDWLKKMSNQGWAFKKFFLGLYTFESCSPDEYIYQIDLLDNWVRDKENFSEFMEDSGVEVVSQWYRWVYLRKKATDGPFEMYTDTESKIAQYKRIKNFFIIGLVLEATGFFMELRAAVESGDSLFSWFTFVIGCLVLVFLRMVLKCKWKIGQLKRESGI